MPIAGEDKMQQRFSGIVGGAAKYQGHFGRSFGVFLQS
jgi:hypothetical protein